MARLTALVRRLPAPARRFLKKVPGTSRVRDRLAGEPKIDGPLPGELRAVVYPPTWAQWDTMRQRPQYIIQAFADAGHSVYFVDPSEKAPRKVGDVHIVPTLASTPKSGVILYAHFAPVRTMFDRFDDPVIVYDILDDLSIFDADEVGVPESRRVRTHHAPIMTQADVVIASSPVLVDTHSDERGDILFIDNGVESARFSEPGPKPHDMEEIPGPVIGYHGMVSRWFDFVLFEQVARTSPEFSFAVVGPVDPGSAKDADRLVDLPNVYFVGPRTSDDMPSYVSSFDVGIVPFVVDDMTRAVSPLKMYEYLAAGVPVVATPLPACVDHPLVATSDDPEEFARLLRDAVASSADPHGRKERIAAGAEADWSKRIAPLRDRLASIDRLRVPS